MNNLDWVRTDTYSFNVIFEGDAVKNYEIDANDLAVSLSGISDVIKEANKEINGVDCSRARIVVKSDFKPGSFLVDLALLLTSTNIQAVINILEILGFFGLTAGSLIQIIKMTK
jgi:hypothetical protein